MLAAFSLPAFVGLNSCAEALQKNEDGWVFFSSARPINSVKSETPVRFRRQNGCVVMETANGQRFLPILTQGRQFSVEPELGLYQDRWKVLGLDTESERVVALQSDPLAKACNARPAFILDVVSAEPSPPAPEAVQ
jgi:hypothetical protein